MYMCVIQFGVPRLNVLLCQDVLQYFTRTLQLIMQCIQISDLHEHLDICIM